MSPESLKPVKKQDALFGAEKATGNSGKPSLEALFERHGKVLPPNKTDRETLERLYMVRLCLGGNGSSNSIGEQFDKVLPGNSKEERMQTAQRLKGEIDFVVSRTPTSKRKMPLGLDYLSSMGITGVDRRKFLMELRKT